MQITAAQVKELRERTGSGMMECKKALVEAGGDIEAAVELMRKAGMAKADKKAGRVAAEGRIVQAISADGKMGAMAEVNCETDFVANGDDFVAFSQAVAGQVLNGRPAGVDALMALPAPDGRTLDEWRRELIAKLGENISVRRFAVAESSDLVGAYLHGARIGVLVALEGGDAALAKDIAMHVAASRPTAVAPEQVPAEVVEKEKEIFRAQALDSGKPADIVEKMITGRVRKFLSEITLLGQPFVKNPDQTVEKLLAEKGARVASFIRFEVGEGIEKKSENFAEEVMAQVRGG
ncbi:MAG TPA: elongation factor Ts [Gammaproteobacteria bacterium]|nr:elongation factor Ts [Gammaproteobacteria bacterium]